MRDIDNNSTLLTKFMEYTISFESRFYDYRMRTQLHTTKISKDIALINIDDHSLEKIGIWPIPRAKHALMMDRLSHFGAKVVALDILYPEKAPVCGTDSPDAILADAFKNFTTNGGTVFLAYTTGTSKDDSLPEVPGEMYDNSVVTKTSPGANMTPYTLGKYTFPIEEFISAGVGVGSIAMNEDPDGIFRQYLLILNIDTVYFGSLGFNAWEAYTGNKATVSIFNDAHGEITLGKQKLEINNHGETKIRFTGGLEKFPMVSLWDLLDSKDNDPKIKEVLSGKIVYVGSTALGAHDLRNSPIDSKMPGVLAHMNITQMLLDARTFKPSDDSVIFSIYLLIAGMLIFLLIQRLDSAFYDLFSIILIVGGSYFADQYYFMPEGYELKLFYCYFCFVASYSWSTFLSFKDSNREKKQIKGTFARYVAPTIVDEMLKDPEKLQVGGFKRDITCLFSDVRDFTSISEGLSASDLAQSLNMYMGRMTDIVFETKGTLDKYIGDAIVAFWGAPLEIGNHAQYAVEGAIAMMNKLPAINEEFRKLGRPEFKVGIGLNSGECNVGNMGSERIFSYTALGDNMNLGARLESLCKHYGVQILISEYTLARLDTQNIKYRPIDRVIVKGKTTPVACYEVLHDWHPMSQEPVLLELYLKAHKLFLSRDFKGAYENFDKVAQSMTDDKSCKRMKELCQKFIDAPELVDDMFDVTKMTEK